MSLQQAEDVRLKPPRGQQRIQGGRVLRVLLGNLLVPAKLLGSGPPFIRLSIHPSNTYCVPGGLSGFAETAMTKSHHTPAFKGVCNSSEGDKLTKVLASEELATRQVEEDRQ